MSTSLRRCLRGASATGDEGIALLVAIAVIAISGVLMLSMLAFTLRETRQTGRDRQRSSAVSSAEGAVDQTFAAIPGAAPATLPCGVGAPVTTSASPPDELTITTTVTYFDGAGAQIPCASMGTTLVAKALVSATSVSDPIAGQASARRTVESLVRMTPTTSSTLDKAIFADSGITFDNNVDLYGTGTTPDADIYTNGSFECSKNEKFHGSVFAQGTITLSNSCQVDVNAYAKLGYTSSNTQSNVSGDVLVSRGTATMSSGTVGGKVRAMVISPASYCTANPGKCIVSSTIPDPPAQPFPVLNWDSATAALWAAQGYTNVITNNSCDSGNNSNGVAQWMVDNGSSLPGPTVLLTSCKVVLQNPDNNTACGNKTLCLNNHLLVVATGGFEVSNTLTIRSTSSAARNLYLVQPYDAAATHPCTTLGISLDNQVSVESTVNVLLYSPCSIRKANSAETYGQIYSGGTAAIENKTTMYYRPLPVYGVSATTTSVRSYSLDILYKRENR